MNTQIRNALFVNGLSASAIAKKFSLPLTTVEVIFRQLLDLNKAETPKHLKVYEYLVFGGLSPSQIATRMNTGEEDIRGILIDLEATENDASSDDYDYEYKTIQKPESVRLFLQYEQDNEDDYDILRIQKQDEDTYKVNYTYNYSSDKSNEKITTLTQGGLVNYLMNTFHLLSLDKRPFYSIEIHIPMYPTVKFTSNQPYDEFLTLIDAILHSQQI